MGVLSAGTRVRLDRPGTTQIGDIYVYRAASPNPNIRGFLCINLSSATLLVQWQGGQPSGSSQFNTTIGAFEAAAMPTASGDGAGASELYVYSTAPTADFVLSLYDEPVSIFLKSNPATVPTAAAVKLEDGATGGRYAQVSAAGAVLVGGTVALSGTANVDVTDEAGRILGIVTVGAGVANIGDVDVVSLPAGTVAGSASLPAGGNNIGDIDVLTLPRGAVTELNATLVAATAANFAAANAARKGLLLTNATGNDVYGRWGNTASTVNYHFKLADGQTYEPPPGAIPTDALSLFSTPGGAVKGFEL